MMATQEQSRTSDLISTAKRTIPVVKEHLVVDTLKTVTGEVGIELTTAEETVSVPLPTLSTNYREERVPVDMIVQAVPPVREEDGRIIVPIVREETVVIKRLRLVEEIHLVREQIKTERTEEVILRRQEATVRRT